MNSTRTLVILTFVTLFAVIAAALVIVEEEAGIQTDLARAALFPDLDAALESVSEITINATGDSVTIRRTDGRWLLPDKSGYPADQGRVRRLLLAVPLIETEAAKTSDPALYGRLGLRDPGEDGSRARRLTLKDESGRTLAALLVGDRARGASAGGPSQGGGARAYVRLLDEAQSWLAVNVPELSADAEGWLDKTMPTLRRERIKRVAVRHSDGAEVVILRESAASDDFALSVQTEAERADVSAIDSLVSALAFLSFDEVKPVDEVDWTGAAAVTFTAFDGLEVRIMVKGQWARFAAVHEPRVAEEGEGSEVLPASPPDGANEADRLNDRFGGWAYALPAYKRDDLLPRRQDLLEAPEDAGEE